jgi:hypothetical protein
MTTGSRSASVTVARPVRPFRNLRAKSADLESVGFQWVAPGLFV